MSSVFVQLIPFLATAALFFAVNDLQRGEWGGLLYTSTKTVPVLLLCLVSFLALDGSDARNRRATRKDDISTASHLRSHTCLALLMSAVGDLFLATRSQSQQNFLAGTIPFGIAHLFYILSYTRLTRIWWPAIVPFAANWCVFVWQVFGRVPNPVMSYTMAVYAVVLSAAAVYAISYFKLQSNSSERKWALCRVCGFLSFALSDSLLTLDAYMVEIWRSQLWVMITYYLAQLLIFLGNYGTHRRQFAAKKAE